MLTDAHRLIAAVFVLVIFSGVPQSCAQIGEKNHTRYLRKTRIQELENIAVRLEHSINPERYACDSYYDYVCSRNRPLFSVLGHQPETAQLIELISELHDDPVQFEAKDKLNQFLVSCGSLKPIDDCYRETFEYFRPLFGYIVTKNHIDPSSHRKFLEVLREFVQRAEHMKLFERSPILPKLSANREKFRTPAAYFQIADLNREFAQLKIYRESYQHNLHNLQLHRRRNSTYEQDVGRTMLDWSLYLLQSRDKPMSYYFPTLNVHLWMTLYNSTVRSLDRKRFDEIVECLKLPQFVNVLDEARTLAVVYVKSFENAWENYGRWITASHANRQTFDEENDILRPYHLNNKSLFFTLYAQNFCDFGKELAENVFYLGLRQNQDFFDVYACGHQTEGMMKCI